VNPETTLWKGSSSQWLNLGPFVIALLITAAVIVGGIFFPPAWALLVFPALYVVWRILVIRTRRFELTTQRLRVTEGVFNQTIDEIELYRVKDIAIVRPFWMRLTGLASVTLQTSDRSQPVLDVPAIPDGVEVRELLRKQVELIRDSKRVRELDMDGEVGGFGPDMDVH
jgi:uncharacterized membrane protein YdbT with pleckstrin-like domain